MLEFWLSPQKPHCVQLQVPTFGTTSIKETHEGGTPGREHIPFSDDYRLRDWSEGQPGYIEVPGGQGPPDEEETPQEEYTPSEPPDHMPVIPEEEETPPLPQPAAPAPERQTTEPEIEMIPATVPNTPVQAAAPGPTPLQQAMHRNLNALDGHPSSIRPPPGLSRRERSRSPVREARNVPAPRSSEEGLLAVGQLKHSRDQLRSSQP